MAKYFPKIPNYENFLKSTNKSLGFILVILKYLLYQNSSLSSKYHFIDSTDLPVCKNYNIYNHKVAKDLSTRGKTTKGWFYGIKLHGVCNIFGDLENVFFTSGNVHDNQVLNELLNNISGVFICDSGYLLDEVEKNILEINKPNIQNIITVNGSGNIINNDIHDSNLNISSNDTKELITFFENIIGNTQRDESLNKISQEALGSINKGEITKDKLKIIGSTLYSLSVSIVANWLTPVTARILGIPTT